MRTFDGGLDDPTGLGKFFCLRCVRIEVRKGDQRSHVTQQWIEWA